MPTRTTLGILIVDDEPMIRNSIRRLLRDDFEGAIFGEAGTVDEALDRAREESWDFVLLDLQMPGKHGLTAIGPLKALCPDCQVIVLSGLPEEQYADRALRAGAVEYVPKEMMPERIAASIKAALARRTDTDKPGAP